MSSSENRTDENRIEENRIEENREEWYRRIEETAEHVEVPQSLSPEHVKTMLEQKNQTGLHRTARRAAQAAAALAVLVLAGGVWFAQKNTSSPDTGGTGVTEAEPTYTAASSDEARPTRIETVGDYVLAKSDEDIYDAVEAGTDAYLQEKRAGLMTDGAVEESAAAADESAYSNTNVQVEGVDESDFVKTDGTYLYVMTEEGVSILTADDTPETAGTISLGDGDYPKAMYLDGTRLYLVLQEYDTELTVQEDSGYEDIGGVAVSDVYEQDTSKDTAFLTYDVSDPAAPAQCGKLTLSGSYQDSRMTDGYFYLFTRREVYSTDEDSVIPEVNGTKVSADCCYVQEDGGTQELVVASVALDDPTQAKDALVLVGPSRELYMGTDAIYLYRTGYDGTEDTYSTDIVKFTYSDGWLSGKAALHVKGCINDTFAISESGGVLRLLMTEYGETDENSLHLYDEDLNETGSLSGIASGETVYAARYIGTTAYFITYRNTDPLFAVDISDVTAPVQLGYVKMSGYSDYLHPFSDGLLLGIGYETDEDSISQGIKLTMFDISDPTALTVLDSVVLDADSTSATYDYKCVFVDTDTGEVGFPTLTWGDETAMEYVIYQWDGSSFQKVLGASLDNDVTYYSTENVRGLYAGDHFFIVGRGGSRYYVNVYDRANGYASLGTKTE